MEMGLRCAVVVTNLGLEIPGIHFQDQNIAMIMIRQ
jgi:hypothetical protein